LAEDKYMEENDRLFYTYDLRGILENTLKNAFAEIDSYQADYLLNVSIDDLLEHLYDKYAREYLELHTDKIVLCDHGETASKVNDYGRMVTLKSNYYVFAIPFTGDENLFLCKASTYTFNPPSGRVVGNEVHLTFSKRDYDGDALKQALNREIETIARHVEWVRRDVEQYNTNLKSNLLARLNERKAKLLKDKGLLSSLGIPVRQRDGAPQTYMAPVKRKRIATAKPVASKETFAPEPELQLEIYEQILNTLRNMVFVMERSPRAFSNMGEEDLRTHFLVQLNGQYEGQATGETFNYEGKTDILIRVDGKNVFIAECKFWKGPKALNSTIDQLLGYLSWRDTKAAILLFNRNKDFSVVLSQIPAALENHPNFKRHIHHGREAEFRSVLHSNNDKNRELVVTVLAFDIPAITN
jgi:hypothetical protein